MAARSARWARRGGVEDEAPARRSSNPNLAHVQHGSRLRTNAHKASPAGREFELPFIEDRVPAPDLREGVLIGADFDDQWQPALEAAVRAIDQDDLADWLHLPHVDHDPRSWLLIGVKYQI